MRAKVNAAIIQSEPGHLVLKIYNGYGDPEIPFVADSVQLDDVEIDVIAGGLGHTFGTACHCGPTVEGSVVKHR